MIRLPAESTPTITVEIVAEVPLLELLAMPPQPDSAATSRNAGMRIQTVRELGSGDDVWASPQLDDTAILGDGCDGPAALVALVCATVPVVREAAASLFRCQILHKHTAADTSGRRWNESLHPTEEALIAIEVIGPTAGDGTTSVEREPLPIPGRPGVGRVRPGIHTITLALNASGDVTISGAEE